MTPKAVLMGAGQIGRGFIGQILSNAGYEIVFLDVDRRLVEAINRYGQYKVIVMGAEEQTYIVEGIRAYTPDDPRAVDELADAELLTTAVGPDVLTRTAPLIAAGIIRRFEAGCSLPLTVIACENMEFGSFQLESSVHGLLNQKQLAYCGQYIGFPDAEVSRMVMPIEDDNPLTVKVEQYVEWVVDSSKVKSGLGQISGLKLSPKPDAYVKRKIFTLTGHAMLGYLGYQANYTYIYQAAFDDHIFETVFGALVECGKGWCMEYGMSPEDFHQYIALMLRRFSDVRMKDPCIRVCRQPLRKLSANERFISPARAAIKHGIRPWHIVQGIQAAIAYDCPEDEQASALQEMLRKGGKALVLEKVCGLTKDDMLYDMIATSAGGIAPPATLKKGGP
ncbi:MAG: mannitol-1-phosphate 5-dehydrogenase [Clostridia bacterium]|nr:mannitol-1-phosphate 5-dehydrogenase [Clostridia bacterium]